MVHIIRSSKPRIAVFQPTASLIDTVGRLLMFLVGIHTENVQLQQWTENDSTAQQWNVIRQGNGAYKIVNVASGLLMDVRGGSRDEDAAVIQFHGSNQQWYLTQVGA
jgi:hypothetical protein